MQTQNADILFKNNQFFLTGDLTYSNVMSIYEKSLPDLYKCLELRFDFSRLKSSDSSGLALMIEWIKFSKHQHRRIQFLNLSKELMAIAKVAGIDGLISR